MGVGVVLYNWVMPCSGCVPIPMLCFHEAEKVKSILEMGKAVVREVVCRASKLVPFPRELSSCVSYPCAFLQVPCLRLDPGARLR
jgi:hypothetical protein